MQNQWSPEIVRVLENWARWVVSEGSAPRSPYPAYNLEAPGPRAGSTLPTLNGEAEDADAVISALTHRFQHPLRLNYSWPNVADRVNARRCNCCLNTYKSRLDEAHRLFAMGWYARPGRAGLAGTGIQLGTVPTRLNTAA